MKQNDVAALLADAPAPASQSAPALVKTNPRPSVRAKAVSSDSGSADAAVTGVTGPQDDAADEPDLLVPASENTPLPRRTASRRPEIDSLYEGIEEEQPMPTSATESDQDQVGMAWLLVVPEDPAGPGGGPPGKSGARSKDKAGGASAERPKAVWSDSDMPMESGDRLFRVAVVAHTFIQELRPPKMDQPGTLPAPRPKSKAECERRCGSAGFCDPSDVLGCGGLHCGRQRDMLY
jgi:hypothetical protein